MKPAATLPTAAELERSWREDPRWRGIHRGYGGDDVVRLRGSIAVEHSIARLTAEKLWRYLAERPFVNALGALTGNQAMQQVKAGLDAIYLSGWQVAGDANLAGEMYPDQSLYPADSVPSVVRRINNTLRRADEICHAEGDDSIDWFKPIVADAEAGFGGVLNAFELMKQMIEAGAAGVHFEDQLSSAKKCGHMGGKVLVPTQEAVNKLVAARLAADVCNVPTLLVARTDAEGATLLTADVDERDRPFIDAARGRTSEGFFTVHAGLRQAIARGCAYAPYADLVWCETGKPDLEEAREFAAGIHRQFPGKMLAYNCSPSFNWKRKLDGAAHDRLRGAAAGGIRRRSGRLHRHQAPARGGRRLLRCGHADGERRHLLDHCAQRQYRGAAVQQAAVRQEEGLLTSRRRAGRGARRCAGARYFAVGATSPSA
jgi:isocitrate lyase